MAWQEPKTDWAVNPKNPVAEDFNRIEGNVGFLKGDIETKKGAIVDALNTVGLASQLTDTHATLASRITAANQGAKIITPSTANQTIVKGFHSGQGYVKGDANLVAGNIKQGVSIFGVAGSLEPAILSALGLPSLPVGVSSIGGRFKTVTATGSEMFAPSGKTWVTLNTRDTHHIFPRYVTSATGRGVTADVGYPLYVLEIDLPSEYYTFASGGVTANFGTSTALIVHISGRSTAYSTSCVFSPSGAVFFGPSVFAGYVGMLAYPITGTISAYNGGVTAILGNWGASVADYTISAGATVSLGTVPAFEQWLMTLGSVDMGKMSLMFDGRSSGGWQGNYLAPPGAVVSLKNTDAYSRVATVSILKLQA